MTTLTAGGLLTPERTIANPLLTLDSHGVLVAMAQAHVQEPPSGDASLLAPAMLDIHTHGAVGEDVMSATPAGFRKLGRFFASHGVGWYLPTTVTTALDETLASLDRIAIEIDRGPQPGEAHPLGIHLEGPFLCGIKRGVHPTEHLLTPDVDTFQRMQQAARGHIRLLTLAPELPGALDLIRHATSTGVRVSLGHTNATAAESHAALEAGATNATHTFNAMRALDHREPGVLGVVLDDDRVYAELIADTVHVAPPVMRLWWAAKGRERAMLVTDSMQATGSGDGHYTLGGLPVTVEGNRALLTRELAAGKETLAGSILTLDCAVENFCHHIRASVSDAARAASITPARMLGLSSLMELMPGQPVSLNRFCGAGQLQETWLRGVKISREAMSF